MRHGNGRLMLVLWVVWILAAGASSASAQNNFSNLSASSFTSSTQGAAPNKTGQEGFGVQVMGGLLWPTIDAAASVNAKAKTGWLIGLGLGGNRGGRVGVEADILYGERTTEITTILGTSDFKQHVVDVPVMLKGNIGSTSRSGASVFVQGGGYFDWLFSGKLGSLDISKDTNGFEVGIVVGGGVEFARVSVQGRYYHGLRAIDQKFDVSHSAQSKSKAFGIFAGVRLN